MISRRFQERLKGVGAWVFFATLGLFSAWRAWSALSTGHIQVRGGSLADRLQHPAGYWFDTGMAVFGAVLFLGSAIVAAVYKLAGAMGWRKLTPIEQPDRRMPPMDDARRRSLDNKTL